MNDEYEFTLNSPLSESDWDKITDTEFEKTDRITFRTKSGKTVEFAKVSEEFEWCHDCKEYDAEKHCCHRFTKVIRETVEEVKQGRPKGKWISGKCSECGEHAPFWPMASTYYKSKFCPNCGADMMEEEDNGTD